MHSQRTLELTRRAQELEGGFCNPMKLKVAEEIREQIREDFERRGFSERDIPRDDD